MRLVFAGTPEFARIALDALLAAGHDVPLVLTQPDRPAGRGLKLTPSPVKQAALAAGIEVAQPRSLRLDGRYPDEAAAARAQLERVAPDVMVVAAYGLILPQWTLDLPRLGCLNIHASLLPRWRGAAPIQRAIEAGDAETGVTIMQMDAGLDTGDMLLERAVPIGAQQTAAQLHDELALAGGQAIVDALAALGQGVLAPRRQPDAGVTYAAKLDKAEAALDCSLPAAVLARRVRAFNPVPGATIRLPGLDDPVKVWRAQALEQAAGGPPGAVLRTDAQGIDIATGQGVLRLLELQKAGGKRQPVDVFVRGWQP
ncbi:methionyl-tRNA formyltransferase [Bordetella bronchiseptica]|uniref:methionyl-tRNA formyltransferase n=1 Tax=Bordetella bronchiseptica TaxID=518 RepID=UPI000444CC4F|nr:methionyl-tRNA formyltransferase [Bordetella bronchiseptica]KDB61440.1 methionyl-tRNA formyltransferase [Bordetella bronchiseptica B18-5 (C3)]KDC82690.1 methionyl-tRNA formyltransferase [Bordetella bronchiseptica MBORD665]KDC89428.1 methionyl-tRNA formyltransferase [Bordetella bronchiseptica MBORD668]KDD19211.1 methionyl-tRNA formyltransferase [Bordetella bronchiseptica MBORD731]KDD92899.1 methionyl-tRNA formyltransferase [Bordetella bronchiseptica MBORD762]